MKLNDQVVIVTGAGSGIGKAVAKLFAENGANVLVADINVENGEQVAKDIRDAGGKAQFRRVDVSDADSVSSMMDFVHENLGRVSVLCNNAAATTLCNEEDRRVHELPEHIWDAITDVTLKGTYLCSKYVIPDMLAVKNGSIINVASTDALLGQGGYDSYTAAKGGVVSMTRSMAVGYAGDGIRVNCVCPGFVASEVQEAWLSAPETRKTIESLHLTRIAVPEDIARFILYLAKDDYLTGGIYPVDGGFTAFKTKVTSYEQLG